MSEEFDWSQFEDVKEDKFDWSQFKDVEKEDLRGKFYKQSKALSPEAFGPRGKHLGGLAGGLAEAIQKKPSVVGREVPVAAAKAVEDILSFPKGIAGLLEGLLGKPDKLPEELQKIKIPTSKFAEQSQLPSEKLAEWIREGLDPEERRLSEQAASAESALLQLLPWGKLASGNLPKGIPEIPTTLKGEIVNPEGISQGLTKFRASEAKKPGWGIISQERQANLIEGLNKEASEITKKTSEKHLPTLADIEAGKDLRADFDKNFSEIKKTAAKYNPEVNIQPINKFLRETASEYRDIPDLHKDARKIMKEIARYRTRPASNLDPLLRIYRSNNKKISDIGELSRIKGSHREYVNFLRDVNKNIVESFKITFPEDSSWLKQFLDYNSKYSDYINTLQTKEMLRPMLEGKATAEDIKKLAENPLQQKLLIKRMGKEGGQEIIDLAKELKEAIESIEKIPARKWTKAELAMLGAAGIPLFGTKFKAISAIPVARRIYGYWLTKPLKRKALHKAYQAVKKGDAEALKESVQQLEMK